MNKYGDTVLRAVQLMRNEESLQPINTWKAAASEMFGQGTWAQRKGCPKNAFLGLYEDGLVKGIELLAYNTQTYPDSISLLDYSS